MLFLRRLHNYYYILTAVLALGIMYPFIWFLSRHPSRYSALNKVRRFCAYLSATASGIFFNIKHEVPINWSRTYIVCPNHTSNLDILSMCIVVKNNYHFISKAALLNNPFFAPFLKTVDIPVDRDSKISAYRAFKRAEVNLKNGSTLIIFPEGKIGDDYPPILHEFKNGPFRLAIELKIPILPVTSLNTWQIQWDSGFKLGSRPGICDIFVHKPIETAHLTIDDADMLKDKVYNVLNTKFNEANADKFSTLNNQLLS